MKQSCHCSSLIHNIQLSMLNKECPSPNSKPNAPKCTIYQKHCHNLCVISYPKQFNKQLEVCTPTFPQTKWLCKSPPHLNNNHIGHSQEPSTHWHSTKLMAQTTSANLSCFDKQQIFSNQPMVCTYKFLTSSLVVTYNVPWLTIKSPTRHDFLQFKIPN